ncbi:MAG: GIY-YIG nuclease family protein [Patescibacteria group bacterium]
MSREKTYYVYIMANPWHTVLYIGVTNDIERRVWEHKQRRKEGFTKKYNVVELVHHEETDDIGAAIAREKELKGWLRKKKDALITRENPSWIDLAAEWYGEGSHGDPSSRSSGTQDDKGKI